MKKSLITRKLKIELLEVQSFVTNAKDWKINTVKGGQNLPATEYPSCLTSTSTMVTVDKTKDTTDDTSDTTTDTAETADTNPNIRG